MLILTDDSHHALLGADDDDFHPANDQRWFHETSWFWWFVPEHAIAGWFYNWVRPNVGTSGGGAWVWDASTPFHFEVPYYACYSSQPLDPARDLRDHRYPSGVTVRTLQPLQTYELSYTDRDLIDVRLTFDAIMPPWAAKLVDADQPGAAAKVTHFDQVGRVTGAMAINGARFAVDCLAIRDRTWTARPERWKDGHVGYCNAADDQAGVAFLAQSAAGIRGEGGEARVNSGYYLKDGRRLAIVDGTRVLDRHPDHGYFERITVDAEDSSGRRFNAVGTSLSRMAMPIPGVHGVVWTSLVDWRIDGVQAWGEDQDAWPINGWSAFRRGGLGVTQ